MIRQSSRQLYRQYQLERRKKREEKEKSPTKESSQKHARHSSHHGGASWHGGEGHGVSSHGERSTARSRSFATLFWQFLGLLRGHGMAIGFALATLTVSTLLKLVPPLGIKVVIDYVLVNRPLPSGLAEFPLPQEPTERLVAIAIVLVIFSALATLIHLWGRWYATKSVNLVQVTVRKRVFEHAVRLPLHRVYELKSGGATSLLREDAGGVADLVFSLLYNPWQAIIQLMGSLIILATVDWRMMLAGLILIPVVYVTHRTWISRIRPLYKDVRAHRQEIDGQATEVFGGMRVVRAFGRERRESSRFVLGNALLVRKQLLVWWWSRTIEIAWALAIPIASTLLLVYGGHQILQGHMTLGDLTMFLVYLAMLLDPLATLAMSATSFQNQLAGLDRVLDILQEPTELPDQQATHRLERNAVRGEITFRDVAFHYPGNARLVLQTIDLDVPAGTTVALVGRSGAGKTTLCNLVARFYDPTQGTVELDGTDLRDLHLDSYRSLLGMVEQDVFLFDGTIAENIGYPHRNADPSAIEQAARAAHAHEFIAQLERGYDTVIGERGVKLSGGQRQRLAIARALLADPRILILDEATSNLDSESERLIQDSLRFLLANRTCFVIAHRLSTITHADQILVMEDGRIVERGTHAELMAASGRYRRMVELQTESQSTNAVLAET